MNSKKKPVTYSLRFSSAKPAPRSKLNNKVPALNLSSFNMKSSKNLVKQLGNTEKSRKQTLKSKINSFSTVLYDNPQQVFENLNLPVSAETVLEKFSSYLSQIEKDEIVELGKIYFLALNIPKLLFPDNNTFFDDKQGNYNLIQGDSLAYRFEILEILGRGSFSQVCKCLDHRKEEIVAVKIVKSKKKFAAQAVSEIRLLENINLKDIEDSSNIIHLKESFTFRGHTCLVFDCYSLNLYQLLKVNNFKGLSQILLRKIISQLLTSLKFLKSCHIIHCDIKPENILLKNSDSSTIKLIDLGSGCYEHERIYSYIQARFYRSPEVLLGIPYTAAIDMWSLGCVLAELHLASPLFPGNNEVELMALIQQLIDTPPVDIINRANKRKIFFDRENRPRLIFDEYGKLIRPGTLKLEEVLKSNDSKFIDFIARKLYLGCLIWDPKKRMTPEEGLRHDWISDGQQKKKSLREVYK